MKITLENLPKALELMVQEIDTLRQTVRHAHTEIAELQCRLDTVENCQNDQLLSVAFTEI